MLGEQTKEGIFVCWRSTDKRGNICMLEKQTEKGIFSFVCWREYLFSCSSILNRDYFVAGRAV